MELLIPLDELITLELTSLLEEEITLELVDEEDTSLDELIP